MKSTYRGKILLVDFRAEAAVLLKVTLLRGYLSRFLDDAMMQCSSLEESSLSSLFTLQPNVGIYPLQMEESFFKKNIAFDWYELEVRVKFPDINKGNN